MNIFISERFNRVDEAAPCPCGGYADKVEPTEEEDLQNGCGRPRCCSRAFVCRICKARLVGRAESPEME